MEKSYLQTNGRFTERTKNKRKTLIKRQQKSESIKCCLYSTLQTSVSTVITLTLINLHSINPRFQMKVKPLHCALPFEIATRLTIIT